MSEGMYIAVELTKKGGMSYTHVTVLWYNSFNLLNSIRKYVLQNAKKT